MHTDLFLTYQPAPNLLKNRVILVTGAGDGIGKAAALSFAQFGATVILMGRTQEKLEQTYDQIMQNGGPIPALLTLDLNSNNPSDYGAVATALQNEFGRLDGLLHNAGFLGARTPIAHYPNNDWQKALQINVTSPFLLTQALLPLLTEAPDARILFTGSSVGVKGRAFWGGYAVAKGATETLMQVLADELDNTHIKVHSINPGGTRTNMRAQAYPAENPAGVTAPEAIMNRYLFLMGPDSQAFHGLQWDAQSA